MSLSEKALTDERFADLLAVPNPHGVRNEHEELAAMRSVLRGYRVETTQWAERRSAGQPSLAQAAQRSERWAALPQWSLALVAVVSIAGGIVHLAGNWNAADESAVTISSPQTATEEVSQADIARDNRLLSSIDEALSYHAASPVDSFHLQGAK